jgi:DNA helicase-2/ATP-dependent DNA helicase PcrA
MSATLLANLNSQQRRAVTHEGGPLLVLAGAGSGKTRVITTRIAHLVAQGMHPSRILALTFTNKAAGEMKTRLASLIGKDATSAMTAGTFHGLGLRLISEQAERLRLFRPICLLDAGDQAVCVRQVLHALGLDPRRHDPQRLLNGISRARHGRLAPGDLGGEEASLAPIYEGYMERKASQRAADFDDLILLPVQLMREDEGIRAAWQERWDAILVDEYQDTSATQFSMVQLLAEGHGNLAVVGDDDQSIYGWRGACVDNILSFEDHFPNATVIALEQNYRSTGHILDVANAVIGHNRVRKQKDLWTEEGAGEPVSVITCKNAAAEASFVAAEIHRRHRDEDRPYSHCGVLFRAGTQAKPLEEALRLVGIPYRLVGAYQFFERKEIKDVLAYLRLLVNPRDHAGFLRVVNFPRRGVGPKRLAALLDESKRRKIGALELCRDPSGVAGIEGAVAKGLRELSSTMGTLRRAYHAWKESRIGSLGGLIQQVVDETGARTAWIRDPSEGPGGIGRWKSVEAFMEMIDAWERRNPSQDLLDYLRLVALEGRQGERDDDRDEVTLMTIHSAKGLEWPVAFVVGCQEGLIPHQRTLDEGGDLSEERRLFYVAITRARRSLFLTRATERNRYGQTESARPSRFLSEIPEINRRDDERSSPGPSERSETRNRLAELAARYGRKT